MRASTFLRLFGWCSGAISPKPSVTFDFDGEIAELYLASDGNVKWHWKKAQQKDKVNLQNNAIPPKYCKNCVAFTVCAYFSPVVQGGPECLEVARRYSMR